MQSATTEKRSIFDWLVFIVIHVVLIGAIGYAGFAVYGARLGAWVAASAFIAGMVSFYLFAKIVPGETLMKVWLGLCVALNAGYIVHNGARAIGIEAFNAAQVKKFEAGIAAAAQAQSRAIARTLGASAKDAATLEKVFDDGVSLIAAILAFLELASAIVIFSIASKRVAKVEEPDGSRSRHWVFTNPAHPAYGQQTPEPEPRRIDPLPKPAPTIAQADHDPKQ